MLTMSTRSSLLDFITLTCGYTTQMQNLQEAPGFIMTSRVSFFDDVFLSRSAAHNGGPGSRAHAPWAAWGPWAQAA